MFLTVDPANFASMNFPHYPKESIKDLHQNPYTRILTEAYFSCPKRHGHKLKSRKYRTS